MTQLIEQAREGGVLRLWLNRPERRNALNAELIAALAELFQDIQADAALRLVVLCGRGPVFCSGADLAWMRETISYSEQQNLDDALRLAGCFAAVDACPVPLLAGVQRGAFGGALGLLACCDHVVCTSDSTFAFPEVRIGIAPATIAPFVLAKIGSSQARAWLLSGARFTAAEALQLQLVQQVVEPDALDAAVEAQVQEFLAAGPQAARATKALIRRLAPAPSPADRQFTAELIARLRVSAEGQTGLAAALDKLLPPWHPDRRD